MVEEIPMVAPSPNPVIYPSQEATNKAEKIVFIATLQTLYQVALNELN